MDMSGLRQFCGRQFVVCFLAALAPQICGAVATDLSLEPPMNRSVEFEKDVGIDIDAFLAENNIQHAEEKEQPDGSVLINFFSTDKQWAQQQPHICGMPGVVRCDTNLCREFLADESEFAGKVTAISGGPVAGAKIALLPTAPDISDWAEDDTEEDEGEDSALVNLQKQPGPRSCPTNQRGGAGPILAQADASGGFSLPIQGDGFDPGCWELKAGNACEVQELPTRSVMPEFEPNRVLAVVPMDENTDPQAVQAVAMAIGAALGFTVLEVAPLNSIERALIRFEIPKGGPLAQAAAAALALDPRVESSQREHRYRSSATDDPFAWMNYGAKQIGAERLLGIADGAGVTVAVIDTGVDASHPELQGRVSSQVDVTGFGFTADRHGTAIAGIIAAETNNGVGSYGVAPATNILAIKACEPESRNSVGSRCWSSTIAKALDKALQSEASVINMSLGGPDDELIKRLVEAAVSKDRLVVAAAGNDGPNAPPPFPASHEDVVAVTAVDARDRLYSRAVRGAFIDVAAPGVEIAAPAPGETYPARLTGTSMATAHVSGAAALLLSINTEFLPTQARDSLLSSTVDLGAPESDDGFGRGRIDVCAAASELTEGQTTCPESASQR